MDTVHIQCPYYGGSTIGVSTVWPKNWITQCHSCCNVTTPTQAIVLQSLPIITAQCMQLQYA